MFCWVWVVGWGCVRFWSVVFSFWGSFFFLEISSLRVFWGSFVCFGLRVVWVLFGGLLWLDWRMHARLFSLHRLFERWLGDEYYKNLLSAAYIVNRLFESKIHVVYVKATRPIKRGGKVPIKIPTSSLEEEEKEWKHKFAIYFFNFTLAKPGKRLNRQEIKNSCLHKRKLWKRDFHEKARRHKTRIHVAHPNQTKAKQSENEHSLNVVLVLLFARIKILQNHQPLRPVTSMKPMHYNLPPARTVRGTRALQSRIWLSD